MLSEQLAVSGTGELSATIGVNDKILGIVSLIDRHAQSEVDLASRPKGHHVKVKIAQQLRRQTPMSRQWIADRLRIGSASYVSNLLSSVDSKL